MCRHITVHVSFILFIHGVSLSPIVEQAKLTFDEFFDFTTFSSLMFSPCGQHLMFQTTRPSWKTDAYENTLWIYTIKENTKRLITKNPHDSIAAQWSPDGQWIGLFLGRTSTSSSKRYPTADTSEQFIYLYSLVTNDLWPVNIGNEIPLAFTWSNEPFSFYFAAVDSSFDSDENIDDIQRSNVNSHRDYLKYERSVVYHITIDKRDRLHTVSKRVVERVSFLIGELVLVVKCGKLVCTSISTVVENLDQLEIYSIDLQQRSLVQRLTDNRAMENNLKVAVDGEHLLFQTASLGSIDKQHTNDTQARLYSLDLVNGSLTRLAERFDGHIDGYAVRADGSIYILGQRRTEVHIYMQRTSADDLIEYRQWNGTYESIAVLNDGTGLAFIYSSLDTPLEVYVSEHVEQLQSARAITNDNQQFTQRELPRTNIFSWKNLDDDRTIEGILHYPPGQYRASNLPLLVLIHGGPYAASRNVFRADWYSWAALAATNGWLVLEPNYRGSVGYGDAFLNEIRHRPLSLPGKDILFGIDQLIDDGTVNPYRVSLGGYSYGGFLTNWLITQSKQFNAALSGAGSIDHTSAWGTMDIPVLMTSVFGGTPWQTAHVYLHEAPIYQLDRVRTPTLISTGENDIRVPASQSYMLERALHHRNIPVRMITFPSEGHELAGNPWHGKVKVREELKWLQTYDRWPVDKVHT
jgi:dipeptidyl aminopeptidase/acylaminoacyl peptidase